MQYLLHVYPSSRPLTPPWVGTSASLNSLRLLWIMFPDLTVEGFNWSHFLSETHEKKIEKKKAVQPAILTLPLITCTLMMLSDYYWIHMSTSVSLPLDRNDVFSLWGIMIVPSSQWIFLPISLVLLIRVNGGDHTLQGPKWVFGEQQRRELKQDKSENNIGLSSNSLYGAKYNWPNGPENRGGWRWHNWFPEGVKEAAKRERFVLFHALWLVAC